MEGFKKKNKTGFFNPESTLMLFLTKAGQVIILDIFWCLSCIPVITAGSATASLYYAVMKAVRRNRSYPVKEYFASLKRTLGSGSILTAVFLIWFILLHRLYAAAALTGGETGSFLERMYLALGIVSFGVLVYLFPVLSRFTMKLTRMVKLAFVMAVRYLGFTIVILAGTAFLAWLLFYYLPMPMIFVLPGAWCYVCTFMIEKALRNYMPAPSENEDAWYYE
jgi:uncharacterized membrane protein YesL